MRTTKVNIRKRVPRPLVTYIGKVEIKQKNVPITRKAQIEETFKKCLQLLESDLISESVKELEVNNLLLLNAIITEEQRDSNNSSLTDVIGRYLKVCNVSEKEKKERHAYFYDVLAQLNLPKDMKEFDYSTIISIQKQTSTLPKRSYSKYKPFTVKQLLKMNIPNEERISIKTQNNYLTWLKSLMSFAVNSRVIQFNPAQYVKANTSTSSNRNQREALTLKELNFLLNIAKEDDTKLFIKVLYLSGLRLSEIWKCKISSIHGIYCFDLLASDDELKTKSSYRLVPLHKDLVKELDNIKKLKLDEMTKFQDRLNKLIKRNIPNNENKSLYSLRHSFATSLISNDVRPEVVSELMGHAHSTMTMNRYVKGYPIEVLKEAIDCL